jgi:hypothetical protein
LKPTLVASDPGDVLGYKAANVTFPDDTTANQWFDEAHFENYRTLGEVTGMAAESAIRQAIHDLMTSGAANCPPQNPGTDFTPAPGGLVSSPN